MHQISDEYPNSSESSKLFKKAVYCRLHNRKCGPKVRVLSRPIEVFACQIFEFLTQRLPGQRSAGVT